jgi:hypothetical protein
MSTAFSKASIRPYCAPNFFYKPVFGTALVTSRKAANDFDEKQ